MKNHVNKKAEKILNTIMSDGEERYADEMLRMVHDRYRTRLNKYWSTAPNVYSFNIWLKRNGNYTKKTGRDGKNKWRMII